MRCNLGMIDRILRFNLALVMIALCVSESISSPLEMVLGSASLGLLITSILRYSPLYAMIGMNTAKRQG